MKNITIIKIRNIALAILAGVSLSLSLATVLSFQAASAQANIQDSLCKGSDQLEVGHVSGRECEVAANRGQGGTEQTVNDLIEKIINIFSVIVGIIAVIMIIYGGLKFITSGGDSGRLTSAKQTILYALIGLIIVAIAQFFVRFVLTQVNKAT